MGSETSSANSRTTNVLIFLLIASCLLVTDASFNTSLDMRNNPSDPKASSGYECTGALFTGVDINKLNALKNEKGCVAGMLGLSTQLKGYHCLAFKNCPGAECTCEVRQGCSSSKEAADTTKACLYGVKQVSECPADAPLDDASSAPSRSISVFICLLIASCLLVTDAYDTGP